MSEDLAALARAYLGHATEEDQGRILRMAGEGEPKDHEPPPAVEAVDRMESKLPEESWEAVNPPRPGTV